MHTNMHKKAPKDHVRRNLRLYKTGLGDSFQTGSWHRGTEPSVCIRQIITVKHTGKQSTMFGQPRLE